MTPFDKKVQKIMDRYDRKLAVAASVPNQMAKVDQGKAFPKASGSARLKRLLAPRPAQDCEK
jgi:hypothetical protein